MAIDPGSRRDHALPVGFVTLVGEGRLVRGTGGPVVVKVDGEQSRGSVTVFEQTIPARRGPVLHIHHDCDESIYFLEGEFTVRIGDRLTRVGAGGLAFVPRGTTHTFRNDDSVPRRVLVWVTPSGLERFFEALSTLPPGPLDSARIAEFRERFELEIVGPPL